jgi:TrmH family RNA methyltransferase
LITSSSNPKLKLFRRMRRQSLCLVEGVRLLQEALDAGAEVRQTLFAGPRLTPAARKFLERLPEAEEVDLRLLDSIADTVTSQGIVAAVAVPTPAPFPADGHVLVLDGIADPGNAGTMLRTARAAGAAGVVAMRTTTDLWAPKVLRAGMGAHFHLPLTVDAEWPPAVAGRRLLLATARGGTPYWGVDWSLPSAIVVGGEAHGPSSAAAEQASERVTIPMAAGAESLNAAVAAAVLLFEARRLYKLSE